jgi:hypothetical protein
MLIADGLICNDVSGEESTTIVESALNVPNCAVMVAVPADLAVTWPAVLTVATLDAAEVQVTKLVITWVLPSLNVPVATQLAKLPGASKAVAGLTEIEESVAELTFSGAEPMTPLKVAEMLAVPGPIAVAVFTPAIVATA